ncbi:type I methionyl aminopeptidase [Brackiella oedipodis]|uniref:type I methionyl aminopeptidase n=1 Tax=Brackiella oedipodis TaxID=124225 RepID=UPI00048FD304|nr:type I methionyl aminopeptidase [Brackiella oedipodis]
MAVLKKPEDIAACRKACQTAAGILDYLTDFIKPGITTLEIDQLVASKIKELGIKSATLGYGPPSYPPFPGNVCTSVNHVICHGIPGTKVLKKGDILNIDITIIEDGWYGDTSRMYCVGEPSILAKRLIETTFECMWLGINEVKPGARLGDIGHVIQQHAEAQGFSVVREYCGHGIGRHFHEEPQVLHYGRAGTGVILKEGMVFTIEPMINAGKAALKVLGDEWTVVTKDHSLSAQWEHQIIVTADGYEVLTTSPGMRPAPALIQS